MIEWIIACVGADREELLRVLAFFLKSGASWTNIVEIIVASMFTW